jgi:3-dehydroquinate synthase
VAALYQMPLKEILAGALSVLMIDADENNKSLEKMPQYVEHLVNNKLRRNQRLIAIGGGITQDITCFLAANLLRGVDWWFIPTTLLAQADSCIGSKSSINCGDSKNILGTFTPPQTVLIHSEFLKTLDREAICSGIGEMLKVHAIESVTSFNQLAQDYPLLFSDPALMAHYIRRSLEIKKVIIEQDEFDRSVRQVMNYGHSFGHAIESATHYKIPHGIAVTMGMDMANYVAMRAGLTTNDHYERMHPVLFANYIDFCAESIPLEAFLSAISKDKKNQGQHTLGLILPDQHGTIGKVLLPADEFFQQICAEYLMHGRCELVSVNTSPNEPRPRVQGEGKKEEGLCEECL